MRLSANQVEKLVEMLASYFSTNELHRLVRFKLGIDYEDIVGAGATRIDAAFQIILYAERTRHVGLLVQGARALNPEAVVPLLDELGGRPWSDQIHLERILTTSTRFQDPNAFRQKLSRIECWVCRIEYPEGGGTGFLVSPNLVLTNHHVMAPIFSNKISPHDVKFRFDYKVAPDGSRLLDGTSVGLAENWRIDDSPPSAADARDNGGRIGADELDYALVRLQSDIGRAGLDGLGVLRGWLTVCSQPVGVPTQAPVIIVQYPGELRLQLALGVVLSYEQNGLRVRYNARTIGGSSGSPCFDANWELFALHHAGDPDYDAGHVPLYNQGIPLAPIIARMKSRGSVEPFWDQPPP